MKVETEAWVLSSGRGSRNRAELELRTFQFERPGRVVLVEPIIGSWEANMEHALNRKPIDVCEERGEERVVLGNGGVVRVLECSEDVQTVSVGDVCIVFGNDRADRFGYMEKAMAYDSPGSMGVLAKRAILKAECLIPIPRESRFSHSQWAAFSLRYTTAWSNWRVAHAAWRSQVPGELIESPFVFGWGGGTPFAELTLAKHFGARTAMTASHDSRLQYIRDAGILAIDRRHFLDLHFDPIRFREDKAFREGYLEAEERFVGTIEEVAGHDGASVVLDYIGTPVFRASLRALGRAGVLASAGWKEGMNTEVPRAVECIRRHMHVYTHFATYSEGVAAITFAEKNGWIPSADLRIYSWSEVPLLAEDYRNGKCGYFPLFQVN